MKKSVKSKKKKILICNILLLLLSLIFIYCIIKIYNWQKENINSKEILKEAINTVEIKEDMGKLVEEINPPSKTENTSNYISDYYYYMKIPFISVNFEELINKNSDTVGWIKVNGTDINYPIVQSLDNSFYLNHTFDKSYNSSGWIFADYRCDLENLRENTIIYGHNRHDNTMFGTLLNVTNKNWCDNKDNRIIYLSTKSKDTMWQIFSVFEIDKDVNYLNVYFINEEEHQNYLINMKNRSMYDFEVPVTTDDKIITLSTCTMDSNSRIVVQAKLIKTTYK